MSRTGFSTCWSEHPVPHAPSLGIVQLSPVCLSVSIFTHLLAEGTPIECLCSGWKCDSPEQWNYSCKNIKNTRLKTDFVVCVCMLEGSPGWTTCSMPGFESPVCDWYSFVVFTTLLWILFSLIFMCWWSTFFWQLLIMILLIMTEF